MKTYSTSQVQGYGRGAKLLVPTINLKIPPYFAYAHGIYAGYITLVESKTATQHRYPVAIHFGPKPTFPDDDISLEANIIDLEPQKIISYRRDSIYISLVSFVRPIIKFADVQSLLHQIHTDIQNIKQVLAHY